MLNLKLAEYKDGKFERFLELGSDFGNFFYCGDCVGIYDESMEINNGAHYFKDEKDPLNRFNGRFNGRTYGDGRFVLEQDDRDEMMIEVKEGSDLWGKIAEGTEFGETGTMTASLFFNLHEQPELWEKIK